MATMKVGGTGEENRGSVGVGAIGGDHGMEDNKDNKIM